MKRIIQMYREADGAPGSGGNGDPIEPTDPPAGEEPTPPVQPPAPVIPLDPAVIQAMVQAEAQKLVAQVRPQVPVIEGTDIPAPSNWDDMDVDDQRVFLAREQAKSDMRKEMDKMRGEFQQELAVRDSMITNTQRVESKTPDELKPYLKQVQAEMPGIFIGPLTDQNVDTILLLAEGKRARDRKGASAAPITAGQGQQQPPDTSDYDEITAYLPLLKDSGKIKEILNK